MQINRFYVLEHKESGYEGVTVLPIFGEEAIYIPRNKVRARSNGDYWSDEEEDWTKDTSEDGVVLVLGTPKTPRMQCTLPPLSVRMDLIRSVLSLPPRI